MDLNTGQSRHSTPARRWPAFLWSRTVVSDIVQGIVAGGVLAFCTVILVLFAELRAIHTNINGWITTLKCGEHRNGIPLRAACANDIGALNFPEEEVYWQTFVDGARHRPNGQHNYILRLPPGKLPPNNAAWSVTMGDSRGFMVDNPIHRYSLGDRSGLVPNADGSIDIYIQNTAPDVHQSNWLPAPAEGVMLRLRVYQPEAAILNGTYRVPPLVEVEGSDK
jgi:hypothetical protein